MSSKIILFCIFHICIPIISFIILLFNLHFSLVNIKLTLIFHQKLWLLTAGAHVQQGLQYINRIVCKHQTEGFSGTCELHTKKEMVFFLKRLVRKLECLLLRRFNRVKRSPLSTSVNTILNVFALATRVHKCAHIT